MNTKEKFYKNNIDLFLRYFESRQKYEALINAGKFTEIEETIKANSNFNLDEFIKNNFNI
jgi:hypothetical protein